MIGEDALPDPSWVGPASDQEVGAIFRGLAAVIEPRPELEADDPFQVLVAVVLSAQATDRQVNWATERLFQVVRGPADLVGLGPEGLKPYIRTIGLFNAKARYLAEIGRLLLERHGGEVPCQRSALEALPGVGRKSAGVVLNFAFNQPTIPVDTHVHRVANRTGIARTRQPEQTERVLLARTPARHRLAAHHLLILHGRYCCTARGPHCAECPVRRWCAFPSKTR